MPLVLVALVTTDEILVRDLVALLTTGVTWCPLCDNANVSVDLIIYNPYSHIVPIVLVALPTTDKTLVLVALLTTGVTWCPSCDNANVSVDLIIYKPCLAIMPLILVVLLNTDEI